MERHTATQPVPALMPIGDAQSLTMTTRGSFHVQHEAEAVDRCGPKGATRQLDYVVTVTSTPAMLDSQGFLMDWQEVSRYFPATFGHVHHFPSCEQIACRAVRDIAAKMPGRLARVTVSVGFHGGPADMVAVWDAPPGWWQYYTEEGGNAVQA